jgi:prevent-host-death family protein
MAKPRRRMRVREQAAPTRARTALTTSRSSRAPAKLEWMAVMSGPRSVSGTVSMGWELERCSTAERDGRNAGEIGVFERLSQFCYVVSVERIPQRELRNDVSAVLRRVTAGERLRVTVAGRDAADLVPVEGIPSWTSGARARDLIMNTQADPALAAEL